MSSHQLADISLILTLGKQSPDAANLCVGKFSLRLRTVPSFRHHVPSVILQGAKEKMRRSDAVPNVTFVQNTQTFGYRAFVQEVRKAMR